MLRFLEEEDVLVAVVTLRDGDPNMIAGRVGDDANCCYRRSSRNYVERNCPQLRAFSREGYGTSNHKDEKNATQIATLAAGFTGLT